MTHRSRFVAGRTPVRAATSRSVVSLLALSAFGLIGCEAQDLSIAPEVETNPLSVSLGDEVPALSSEDSAVLHFVNAPDTSFAVLDDDVGLDRRAAERIVRHRDGQDGEPGTDDDQLFVSIDEVLAVPWVGPTSIEAIDDYLVELGMDGALVEGVAFTEDEEAMALALANTLSFDALDVSLELDRRAAAGIVDGRPFSDLHDVAAVDYVGPASIERLRAATAGDTPQQ